MQFSPFTTLPCIQGCIFDLDGTLLDSMAIWEQVGDQFLRQYGVTCTDAQRVHVRTLSMRQSAQYFQEEFGIPDDVDAIIAHISRLIYDFYAHEVALKPDVLPLLADFHRAKVPMCVATASELAIVTVALERLQIAHYFDNIFTCSTVGIGKDDAAFFTHVCHALGTPLAHTYVFEDSLHAMRTAKQAGLMVVGVHDPAAHAEQAEIPQICDLYLQNFTQKEVLYHASNFNNCRLGL